MNLTTALVSGVFTEAGSFSVSISATSVAGSGTSFQNYTLQVTGNTAPFVGEAVAPDGWISYTTGMGTYSVNSATADGRVWGALSTDNPEYRSFITIDTTAIPVSASVTDAQLKIYIDTDIPNPITFYLYAVDFGNTLESADYNTAATLLSTRTAPIYDGWLTFDLSPSNVNAGDFTQFEVRVASSRDNFVKLSTSSYAPYILATYSLDYSSVIYHTNTTSWSTIVPPSIEDYNSTHDLYTLVFDVPASVSLISIFMMDASWEYLSSTPISNSTLDGSGWVNLTTVYSSVTYRVYFTVPKTLITTAYLSLYNPNTGKGIATGSFPMYVSPGNVFIEGEAERVIGDTVVLISGIPYYVQVEDFFGNVIGGRSIIGAGDVQYKEIEVPVTTCVFSFSDGHAHKMGIMCAGQTINVTSGQIDLYGNVAYTYVIYEDDYILAKTETVLPSFDGASDLIEIDVTVKSALAYVSLYNPNTGKGLSLSNFLVYISPGAVFDEGSAERLISGSVSLLNGQSYSIQVEDFFGNVIGEDSISGTGAVQYIEVQVSVTTCTFVFSDGNMHKVGVVSSGETINVTSGQIDLYGGVSYTYVVYEDEYILANGVTALPAFSGASDLIEVEVVPKVALVYVSLYNVNTGKGIALSNFLVYISPGESFDEGSAERLISDSTVLDSGQSYSIQVEDFFGNVVGGDGVTGTGEVQYIEIQVSVTTCVFVYSDGDVHKMGLSSSGVTINVTSGQIDLYGGVEYTYTVYEDEYIYASEEAALPAFDGAYDLIEISVSLKEVEAVVYFRYYDATGTHIGEGVEWERYMCYIDGEYQHFDEFHALVGESYEVVVLDFFGNELYNDTLVVNSTTVLESMPVNTYSFKIINSQDYDPVKIKVYYGNYTTNYQFYLGAKEVSENYFKAGNYTVVTIYYNETEVSVPIYFYKNITDEASYINIRGYNNIDEILEDVNGVLSYQTVITNFLTPDVVFIAENLPSVPTDAYDEAIELVHPYSIVHYTMNGTAYENSTVFYYSYYTSQKKYTVTLTLNNTDLLDWENVTWFIGFPENRSIDYSSVRIYDVNNECYMVAGLNYDMTLTGIRMKWDTYNVSLSRTFTITMYDENVTDTYQMPIAFADSVDKETYRGDLYWHTPASWTNDYASTYKGMLQIKLSFDDANNIDPSSIIIFDRLKNRELRDDEWTYSGSTITISYVEIGVGNVDSFDVYFLTDVAGEDSFSIWSTWQGMTIAALIGLVGVGLLAWGYMGKKEHANWKYTLAVVLFAVLAYMMMLEEMNAW